MRFLAIALVLLAAGTARGDVLVLRGARILAEPGKVIESGTVVVKDGKIAAVGDKVTEPPLARVLDASGLTVAPGFVCASTALGLSTARRPTPPPGMPRRFPRRPPTSRTSTEVRVMRLDDVDPWDPVWEAARKAGVTTLSLVPTTMGVGGHGAVIKPVGDTREAMAVRPDAPLALRFQADTSTRKAFLGGFEKAKTWIAADDAYRKALEDKEKEEKEKSAGAKPSAEAPKPEAKAVPKEKADAEKAKTDAEKAPAPKPPSPAASAPKAEAKLPDKPKEDPKVMPFVRALKGEIPVVVGVSGAGSTTHLLPLLAEIGLKPILALDGDTAVRLKEELRASGCSVILTVTFPSDSRTGGLLNAARHLHEAKIPFALVPSGTSAGALTELRHRLALLVRAGLPRDAAIAAATTTPAKLLGLEKRVGAIRPGLDADLVLLDGDVLDPLARVVRVLVNGETVHTRGEATR